MPIHCYWCVEYLGGPLDGQMEIRDQPPQAWDPIMIMPTSRVRAASKLVQLYAYYELDRAGSREVYRYLGSLTAPFGGTQLEQSKFAT